MSALTREMFRVADLESAWDQAHADNTAPYDPTNRAEAERIRYLACLPIVDPERNRLSDRIKAKGLDTRARKFLSCRPESFWGSTARKLAEPEPSYERRLWLLTSGLFTRQSPVILNTPSWDPNPNEAVRPHVATSVEQYIRQFDLLNGLKC